MHQKIQILNWQQRSETSNNKQNTAIVQLCQGQGSWLGVWEFIQNIHWSQLQCICNYTASFYIACVSCFIQNFFTFQNIIIYLKFIYTVL